MSIEQKYQWYALKTKPHKENSVFRELSLRNIKSYIPEVSFMSKTSRQRPLIPGFVFVNISFREIEMLRYIPGSKGLLRIGGVPGIITKDEMCFLRTICEEDGYCPELGDYKGGDEIEIISGPFAGFTGVVSKCDNRKIGVDLCGNKMRVWFVSDKSLFRLYSSC